jgi:tRNA modification GTPase
LLEAAMAAKTREYLDKSDLVLLVMDSSLPDPVIPDGLAELKAKRIIPVANKADISHPRGLKTIQQRFPGTPVVRVSALTGAGLEQLTDTLYQAYFTGPAITPADIVYATAEQQQFIRQLRGELEGLQGSVSQGEPAELWAEHLGQAIRLVAAFTGEELAPAVLERLFAQFCIGK